MGRYTGKTCRLLCMVCLTLMFFLVEVVVGFVTNSLALVGDSYHMLSDVVALLIGLSSVRISKWQSSKNTYGWARAEVLGALVNAVFLIALCFTIFVEALQRLFHDEHIHDENLMLIVGGLGLVINIIGLALFQGHAHSHGGGSHGHSHSHGHNTSTDKADGEPLQHHNHSHSSFSNGAVPGTDHLSQHNCKSDVEILELEIPPKMHSGAQLNMRGVFLHILGDALGSVIVIISGLVIKFAEGEWKYKVDPAMSIVLVAIILTTSIPLLKESALILLQTAPTHIHVEHLKEKLLSEVDGVIGVHDFHIWQLTGNCIIASAHIHCCNVHNYMRVAEDVKMFFHREGIHSTTIQPEFASEQGGSSICNKSCLLDCQREACSSLKCCKLDNNSSKDDIENLKESLNSDVTISVCEEDTEQLEATVPRVHQIKRCITVDRSREKYWMEQKASATSALDPPISSKSPLLRTREKMSNLSHRLSSSIKNLTHFEPNELRNEQDKLVSSEDVCVASNDV